MNYIFHRTIQGERWDNIAYKYYKNSYLSHKIIEANPQIGAVETLEDGIILKIPIDETITESDKSKLPIWRQT